VQVKQHAGDTADQAVGVIGFENDPHDLGYRAFDQSDQFR
jgi:hypothetical protein